MRQVRINSEECKIAADNSRMKLRPSPWSKGTDKAKQQSVGPTGPPVFHNKKHWDDQRQKYPILKQQTERLNNLLVKFK